jgi:hypothetical protein
MIALAQRANRVIVLYAVVSIENVNRYNSVVQIARKVIEIYCFWVKIIIKILTPI